ncbi:carbohydrate kinase family protein [Cohnella rhizosphaerae]|uniref:Carbohydrate kinase family protein n=1 Tax=Cohnella rhizosphaerae TaxID=1457232 RepID=A0A9X4KXY0_9BACL|nr:carbohydrate kinase family protein [Cohnella rhizosphaerae]MDG0813349.1 carbohydrate kinase family protein [Cohnella rhizosphaerae]
MAENNGPAPATAEVWVCGHISIDVIPKFMPGDSDSGRLAPGALIEVGEAAFCTGGAVSNTGIALHRLGTPVRLIGKVSDDIFGSLTLDLLREVHPALAEGIASVSGETSSYTFVVNPPGIDRTFLHCPGTNDTFTERDIGWDQAPAARHFHFGYPPLMKRMYDDDGDRLTGILKKAREKGMTVSLDMAMPGKGTAAYRADWTGILSRALPIVDVFLPSLEEMLMMVNRELYEQSGLSGGRALRIDIRGDGPDACRELAGDGLRHRRAQAWRLRPIYAKRRAIAERPCRAAGAGSRRRMERSGAVGALLPDGRSGNDRRRRLYDRRLHPRSPFAAETRSCDDGRGCGRRLQRGAAGRDGRHRPLGSRAGKDPFGLGPASRRETDGRLALERTGRGLDRTGRSSP